MENVVAGHPHRLNFEDEEELVLIKVDFLKEQLIVTTIIPWFANTELLSIEQSVSRVKCLRLLGKGCS